MSQQSNRIEITPERLKALKFIPNKLGELSKELWDPSVHIDLNASDSEGNHYFSITQQNELSAEATFCLRSIKYMDEVEMLYYVLTGNKL